MINFPCGHCGSCHLASRSHWNKCNNVPTMVFLGLRLVLINNTHLASVTVARQVVECTSCKTTESHTWSSYLAANNHIKIIVVAFVSRYQKHTAVLLFCSWWLHMLMLVGDLAFPCFSKPHPCCSKTQIVQFIVLNECSCPYNAEFQDKNTYSACSITSVWEFGFLLFFLPFISVKSCP